MASDPSKDVDSFLSKVDEIESIVKGLNSGDDGKLKDAMQKADNIIKTQETTDKDEDENDEKDLPKTTTGFSKTVINKSPSVINKSASTEGAPGSNMTATDQSAMMAFMEADAQQRYEQRQIREKEAQVIKEQGNQAFKEGNFEKALEYYNQAIEKVKDSTVLYTNRAQTLIKLGRYTEALKDCDWAQRANPKNIKAFVHEGRAHLALHAFDKARESYRSVLKVDPKKETMVQEYLAEVDRLETAQSAEEKAKTLFEGGDEEATSMVTVMEKFKKADQLPMFYSGGLRLMATLITNEDNQTQFRMQQGLQLLQEHPVLLRYMTASPQSLSKEERDVLTAAFSLMTEAVKNNDLNQEQFLKQEGLPERIVSILSSCVKGQAKPLKTSMLVTLFTVSQTHHGRSVMLQYFDVHRLVSTLFDLIRTNKTYAENAAVVLNNLSFEKKFRSMTRDRIEEMLPSFEDLLKDSVSKSRVVCVCISAMMNLSNDKAVRNILAQRRSLWLASEELLVRTSTSSDTELLEAVLGLLVNVTHEPSDALREFGQRICGHCRSLLPTQWSGEAVPQRALTVLGNVLPHSLPAVEWVCGHGGSALLLHYLKSGEAPLVKHSLKCLTAMTQLNKTARDTMVEEKGIPVLAEILRTKDEGNIGNAALCLSHCTQVPGVCSSLVKTDIVKDALVWARDGHKAAVQQNCGILLAKLAQGDKRNLERLRELHGIEILHSCMKTIG